MIAERPSLALVWSWLAEVLDPELPALSVVDLGIVRELAWIRNENADEGGAERLTVTVTPTYSGCPATRTIASDIERALHERGVKHVALEVRIAPPWTTAWISDAGRGKLRAYGVAPPERAAPTLLDIMRFAEPQPSCPRCTSADVSLTSRFGSTPCKALYRCNACREPFDYFKCH